MKTKCDDPQIEDAEIRELFVGTWLTIGLVADTLAETSELNREQLFTRLVAAETRARKAGRERYIAFAAVRWIVESFAEARQAADDPTGRIVRFPKEKRKRPAIEKRAPGCGTRRE